MPSRNAAPCLIVVFDIAAALKRLALLPALADLFAKEKLHDETRILGLAGEQKRDLTDLRAEAREALTRAGVSDRGVLLLAERLHLERLYGQDETGYEILAHNIKGFERAYGLPGDRLVDLTCAASQARTILEMSLRAGIDKSRGRFCAIVPDFGASPHPLPWRPRLSRQRVILVEPNREGEPLWTYLSQAVLDFVETRCDRSPLWGES